MSTQTVLQTPDFVTGELRESIAIPAREIPAVCETLLRIAKEVIADPPSPEDLDETMAWILSNEESGASFLNCCRIIGTDREGAESLRERYCTAYLEKTYGKGKKGRDKIIAILHHYDGDLCKAVSVQVSLGRSAQGTGPQDAARRHSPSSNRTDRPNGSTNHSR